MLQLVLIEPPCVGKTTFKSLLLKWPVPKFHDNTALATRPIHGIERVAENNERKVWLKVTCDLLKMLSDAIIAIESKSPDSQISEIDSDSFVSVDPMLHLDENTLLKSLEQNSALEECDLSTKELPVPAEMASLQDHQPIQSTLDILHHTSRSNSQKNDKTPVMEESTQQPSGGQSQFGDVSGVFVYGNTMNIICKKLTFDKPHFCYSLNFKFLSLPNMLQMTNLQLIEHFVCSIVSSKNAIVVKRKKCLPVFIITYVKIKGSKQNELENEKLLSTLHKIRNHFVFHKNDPTELIFLVNNLYK